MVPAQRAEVDRTLEIRKRLQKSTDRLWALLQKEAARFVKVMAKTHDHPARTAVARGGISHSRNTTVTFRQILKTAIALGEVTAEWGKDPLGQDGVRAATQRLESDQWARRH